MYRSGLSRPHSYCRLGLSRLIVPLSGVRCAGTTHIFAVPTSLGHSNAHLPLSLSALLGNSRSLSRHLWSWHPALGKPNLGKLTALRSPATACLAWWAARLDLRNSEASHLVEICPNPQLRRLYVIRIYTYFDTAKVYCFIYSISVLLMLYQKKWGFKRTELQVILAI